MIKRDLVIIGGGSAGMAAALEAKKNGVDIEIAAAKTAEKQAQEGQAE